jgi:hypothetical protein
LLPTWRFTWSNTFGRPCTWIARGDSGLIRLKTEPPAPFMTSRPKRVWTRPSKTLTISFAATSHDARRANSSGTAPKSHLLRASFWTTPSARTTRSTNSGPSTEEKSGPKPVAIQ